MQKIKLVLKVFSKQGSIDMYKLNKKPCIVIVTHMHQVTLIDAQNVHTVFFQYN